MIFYRITITLMLTGIIFFNSFSQELNKNNDSLSAVRQEKIKYYRAVKDTVLKYCDPNIPLSAFVRSEKNTGPKMEEYAKNHPPFPKVKNSNYTNEDIINYNSEVANWKLNYGQHFPIFISYSKYSKELTPEDDKASYENAKKEWIKANPEKYKTLEPTLKRLESMYFNYQKGKNRTQDFSRYVKK